MKRFALVCGLLALASAAHAQDIPPVPLAPANPTQLSVIDNGDGTVSIPASQLAAFLEEDIAILEEANRQIVLSNESVASATTAVVDANAKLAAGAESMRLKIESDREVAANIESISESNRLSEEANLKSQAKIAELEDSLARMGNTVRHVSARLHEAKQIGWIPFPISIFAEAISAKRHNRRFWPR